MSISCEAGTLDRTLDITVLYVFYVLHVHVHIGHQRPPHPSRPVFYVLHALDVLYVLDVPSSTSSMSFKSRPLCPPRPRPHWTSTSSTSYVFHVPFGTSSTSSTPFTSHPLYVLDDRYILATSLTTSTFSTRPSPLTLPSLNASFQSRALCPSPVTSGFLDVLCVHDVCSSVLSMPPPHPPRL